MAKFKYEGRDRSGKKSGKVTANSKREAVLKLSELGIRITNIEEIPETLLTKDIAIGNPVKLQEFVVYLRQFSTLLRAGVTIVDATNILAKQTSSKPLRKALEQMEDDLKSGQALSVAAAKHKRIFSSMFVNMIKAGEASGSMEETLDRLAIQYEKQHRTKQKIQSALAYPMAVAIVAVVVVIFLLVSVVPTFVSMFEGFGAQLPAITLFVLNSSIFMQEYWYIVILFFVAVFSTFYVLRKNKQTKYYLDVVALRMPIFGSMIQKAVLARMTRTLSSLFSSSVPILQSLAIVEKIVENEVVAKVIANSRVSLENGLSLTEPMKKHWAFPPLVTQMIAIGEETGSLDEMLGKVADFYEEEVENSTDRLKSLIEPLMIVLLAGIVGTIVIAIIVPMFDIFNHVQM
ncbi:type II secretion system F family protein [Metabacillus endolithicus]|uniref:Type II secretion system F family protein n=1 Tax=Metabacillus endolithicus TaxID=1535204 RepID=A0ABW5BVG8_9BACI|nr:type II secretion system F family protein [Metabacillus endolithicus]UPG64699.1 type II secretion system F family protein [Metabacillus endolithicus]